MIDLSGVQDFNVTHFMLYWLIVGIIAVSVAIGIGQERKLKWFKQRSRNSIILRRGMFGNYSMIGVPVTLPGFIITIGIFAGGWVIWALLVYVVLPLV